MRGICGPHCQKLDCLPCKICPWKPFGWEPSDFEPEEADVLPGRDADDRANGHFGDISAAQERAHESISEATRHT